MIITEFIMCTCYVVGGAVGSASCVAESHAGECRRWGGETLLLAW